MKKPYQITIYERKVSKSFDTAEEMRLYLMSRFKTSPNSPCSDVVIVAKRPEEPTKWRVINPRKFYHADLPDMNFPPEG